MLRKAVYPYEYIDIFNEAKLSTKKNNFKVT